MSQNCCNGIIAEQKRMELQLERLKAEYDGTRNYAKYNLTASPYKDYNYYTLVGKKNPTDRRYLGTQEHHVVQIMQKRRFIEVCIKRIESNLKLMDHFIKKYQTVDPYEIREILPAPYKFANGVCFDMAGAIDIESWAKKKYHRVDMFPQGLKHTDARGEKMRSKSEVIIANSLSAHGIPYRVEEAVYIGKEYRVPDFVALSKKLNREIYWEHFGMMSDERYRNKYINKIEFYLRANIIHGINLISTFDDEDGNIDAVMIEQMIKIYF